MLRLSIFLVAFGLTFPAWGAAPDADAFLSSGKFDDGVAALEAHLKVEPKDDVSRLGLGVTQFVSAVQRLGQKMAVYGPRPRFAFAGGPVIAEVPAPAESPPYRDSSSRDQHAAAA